MLTFEEGLKRIEDEPGRNFPIHYRDFARIVEMHETVAHRPMEIIAPDQLEIIAKVTGIKERTQIVDLKPRMEKQTAKWVWCIIIDRHRNEKRQLSTIIRHALEQRERYGSDPLAIMMLHLSS